MCAKNGLTTVNYTQADLEGLVTEDDTPLDSIYQEKQQRLLVDPLQASWPGPPGGAFIATANVGIFTSIEEPPIVPDALLSLGVRVGEDFWEKKNRSYFVFILGKPPDVTVEFVSNKKGGEDTDKLKRYAEMGVRYYAIFDPLHFISREKLRLFVLQKKTYKRFKAQWMPEVGLGLRLWYGRYEDMTVEWVRWCDDKGVVIPTGAEWAQTAVAHARLAEVQARAEFERAKAESERARTESERAQRLAAKLRQLGIDPDKI